MTRTANSKKKRDHAKPRRRPMQAEIGDLLQSLTCSSAFEIIEVRANDFVIRDRNKTIVPRRSPFWTVKKAKP